MITHQWSEFAEAKINIYIKKMYKIFLLLFMVLYKCLFIICIIEVNRASTFFTIEPRPRGKSGCGANEVFLMCTTRCVTDCVRLQRKASCQTLHCIPGCYCKPGRTRIRRGSFCVKPHTCHRYQHKMKYNKKATLQEQLNKLKHNKI